MSKRKDQADRINRMCSPDLSVGPISRSDSDFWKMRDLVYDQVDKEVREIVWGASSLSDLIGDGHDR